MKSTLGLLLLLALPLVGACGDRNAETSAEPAAPGGGNGTQQSRPLMISAIPDQDPEKLQRLYGKVSTYLSKELGVPVEYRPVNNYTASVTAFKVGDLDLVWYGGLTGVQARLQVPGAEPLAQRDVDEKFHSVFIANKKSGITDLQGVKGRTFTFGSESSTSGRLMPQYFLKQAGITPADFKGEAGFSENHDKTLDLVAAGTYDAGAMNEQVWKKRLAAGTAHADRVRVIHTTPPYHDYHWVLNPEVAKRYGPDFPGKVRQALLKLDASNPEHAEILDLFSAKKFIPTKADNYRQIEAVGREEDLIK
uniref:ABC transporter, substrate-binding protein (Cluster 12, methionine/phosphonates) n=1 Tax=uncultured Armatimonadetes bacterium TaxID=157466 RepID=A0A6J4IIS0_9BACT|nr:ABC transporter, substrate-binding protein (cluster 12, methionine/phosphonates) [uncultured Armatimonadetes bacterium]